MDWRFLIIKLKGKTLFKNEDYSKSVKNRVCVLKGVLFARTTAPVTPIFTQACQCMYSEDFILLKSFMYMYRHTLFSPKVTM